MAKNYSDILWPKGLVVRKKGEERLYTVLDDHSFYAPKIYTKTVSLQPVYYKESEIDEDGSRFICAYYRKDLEIANQRLQDIYNRIQPFEEDELVIATTNIHNGHGMLAISKGAVCKLLQYRQCPDTQPLGWTVQAKHNNKGLMPGIHGISAASFRPLTAAEKVLYAAKV